MKIKTGVEKRVQLVKAPTVVEQRPHVYEADLVIWACGYETNQIPIANPRG